MKKEEKKGQQNHQDDFVDEFLKNNEYEYIDNHTLLFIVRNRQQEKVGEEAALKILEQTPNNYQLTEVIRWISSPKIKKQAALMLLDNNPTNEQLICVIEWVEDSAIKEEAAQKIFEQNPTNNQLRPIVVNVKKLSDKAGWMIYNQHPDLNDLCFLIEWTETFRVMAANRILRRYNELSIKTIQLIMERVPEIIEKSWVIYLKNNPTYNELEWVVRNVKDPKIKEEAEDLLRLVD
jgi:hypothetical protein